jgi:hypothetical protein
LIRGERIRRIEFRIAWVNSMEANSSTPVVAFLIPFAPRAVKSKWETACAQLKETLISIRNSANGDFVAVVAGHEPPDFDARLDSRFHFLSLDHPLPSHPRRGVAVRLDKLAKIGAAWNYAKARWNPRYVMKLDADDFVSSKLVGWLEKNGGAAGYLVKQGWLWESEARYFIQATEGFDRVCGSCLLARSDLVDKTGPFLTHVEGVVLDEAGLEFAARDHYSLVPGSGTGTLLLNDTHQRYAAQFAHLGHELSSLPFRAVVYRANNLDNITGITGEGSPSFNFRMIAGRLRRTRFISGELRREFALP